MLARRCRVLFADPGHPKLVVEPAPAVAAAAQRARFRERISGVIDIAELAKTARRSRRGPAPGRRSSPARGPCATDKRSASLCSSRSGRHSEARARRAGFESSGTGVLGCLKRAIAPFLCHSRRPSGNRLCEQCAGEEFHSQGRDGVLERNASVRNELAPPGATPTIDTQPRRLADFDDDRRSARLCGEGPPRAQLPRRPRNADAAPITYAELREDALVHARRFIALGIKPGDRIALVAETGADFAACFFGAVYAGAWPVPLPLPTSFGGRDAYVDQLVVQLKSCDSGASPLSARAGGIRRAGRRQGRRRLAQLGNARQRSSRPRPTCRARSPTTSPISNIRADRRASRTASRSPTARCSTTSARTASA